MANTGLLSEICWSPAAVADAAAILIWAALGVCWIPPMVGWMKCSNSGNTSSKSRSSMICLRFRDVATASST